MKRANVGVEAGTTLVTTRRTDRVLEMPIYRLNARAE
jgi:hypothetical protein